MKIMIATAKPPNWRRRAAMDACALGTVPVTGSAIPAKATTFENRRIAFSPVVFCY
jgi:hypothetical protein